MPLVRDDDLVRIELTTPDEWVEVRRKLNAGELRRLAGVAAAARPLAEGSASPGEAASILDQLGFAGLEIGIRRWSFEVELTPENLRRLSQEDYDLISARCDELWRTRSTDEKNA